MPLDQMMPAGAPPSAPVQGGPAPGQQPEKQPASDLEQLDLEIAVKLGTKLLKEAGGLKALEKAISDSGDPAQAVSKFLVQLMMQIKEAIDAQGVELSPNIVLGEGGWVNQMLDLIEEELGLPPDFSDEVFNDVMETFKAMSQGNRGAEQAPAGPQGGGLQGRAVASPMPQAGPQGRMI